MSWLTGRRTSPQDRRGYVRVPGECRTGSGLPSAAVPSMSCSSTTSESGRLSAGDRRSAWPARHEAGGRSTSLPVRACPKPTISRIERGHVGSLSIECLARFAPSPEIRLDLVPRWRGGDLDRLLNRAHSGSHQSVARWFRDDAPRRSLRSRGVLRHLRGDVASSTSWAGIPAGDPARGRTQDGDRRRHELLGTLDRKRRLAPLDRRRAWLGSRVDLDVAEHPRHTNEPPSSRGACSDARGCAARRSANRPTLAARSCRAD